jgi:uncharacterized protein involved in exopolysaccharide biosynthesis
VTASGGSEAGLEYVLKESYYNTLLSLDAQLTLQKNNITMDYRAAHLFQYVCAPGVLDRPVGPRKVFNTAVSLAVALLAGVVWAYFQKDHQHRPGDDVHAGTAKEASE